MTLEEQRKQILSGQMYNDLTEELVEARRQYNQSFGKSAAE